MEKVLDIGPIKGTLTQPSTSSKDLVLILHGLGGHRDYCYQAKLATGLAKLGFNAFRFDFRNCGDSQDTNLKDGRSVLGTDMEDYSLVMDYFKHMRVICTVGHSRGVALMFSWAVQNPDMFIPFYVNCSGRFDCSQILKRIDLGNPTARADGGYWSVAKRHGKKTKLWYPYEEVLEYSRLDSVQYGNIHPQTQILTVFGGSDHIVPVTAAGEWANLFDGRHTLEIILGADHNFYGSKNGKHVNYNDLVVAKICDWLLPRHQFERWTVQMKKLEVPRWPKFEAVANFRDFGGYRGAKGTIKVGKLYRCAALNRATEADKRQIKALGITDIFDLRSSAELKRDRTTPVQINGITTHQTPVFEIEDWSPEAIMHRTLALAQSGLEGQYEEILAALIRSGVFAQIVDAIMHGSTILIHCTAGKDRTGVICALILLALGVDWYTICREYELTTIGYAKETSRLKELFTSLLPPSITSQQLDILLGSPFPSMWATLEAIDRTYGGVRGFFEQCGLSREYFELSSKLTSISSLL